MSEIKLVQLPVITHELQKVGADVTRRINELNIDKLVATDQTIKTIKDLRAELNKEHAGYKSDMKSIIDKVSVPILSVKDQFKLEITEKYSDAEATLKTKVGEFETMVKDKKRENIEAYFAELCLSENIDFLKFSDTKLEIKLSVTEKKYKEQCNEFVERIKSDLNLIESQKHQTEILVEYKKTLNASQSITDVVKRKEDERIEKERLEMAEFSRRKKVLLGMLIIHHESTKTFEYNSEIYVGEGNVEKATKEEFETIVLTFENQIKEFKQAEAAKLTKTNPIESQSTPAPVPEVKKVVAPIKAPIEEKKLEVLTAKFQVSGTLPQLKALKAYLEESNLTFKTL